MEIKKFYTENKVIENIEVSNGIYKLKVEGNFKANPGQFYMIRSWEDEPLLSRPVSIHNISEDGRNIEFLYAVVGKGTEFLKRLKSNDKLKLMGPLGNGFNIDEANKGKVAIVCGGIGIAPMNYVISKLKNAEISLFAGFKNEVYGIDNIEEFIKELNISTEDGSRGYKGFITDIFNPQEFDLVLCCGPEIMMNKVIKVCRESNTKVYISQEKKMACGIGACLVCTCKTKTGNKRTCKDGPVFLGDDIEI